LLFCWLEWLGGAPVLLTDFLVALIGSSLLWLALRLAKRV